MVSSIFLNTAILLVCLSFFSLYVAYIGPTIADRMVSINVISTKVTVLIAIFAMKTEQYGFVDVSLVYAMMGFIATICISKYIEKGTLY